MSEDQKKQLETQLWNIANTLRGKMNADEFRDYILGFIFYKYLSERMNLYADSLLETDGIKYADINENSDEGEELLEAVKEESLTHLGYFLKPSELFSAIAKRGNADASDEDSETKSNFILEDLGKILTNIEQSTMGTESEDDFDNLFEDLDLTSTKLGRTEAAKNQIIAKVLAHLDKIDFHLADASRDVLGDAYEYLIGQFASGAGKKAGEFYTPQEVSKVLAKIVTTGKTKLKTVYDPTCGSGSLLLRVAREVSEVGKFYGQELNRTTYNLARMNMILHGVHYQKFDIRQEDSLERPQHFDLRAEAVVANPPFSTHWSASPLHLGDDRFSQYGKLAPSSKADFAFIQHMIHHLADNGIMAVVVPHGALYRGGAEAHIRKYIIENRNYLDAVIGLPENIFYGTDIATCILVFKKCRENPNEVIFIDASEHYVKESKQNFLRDADIKKIIDTYQDRKNEERYSYCASLSEIKENDYYLNIARYVKVIKKDTPINFKNTCSDIVEIEEKLKSVNVSLANYCKDLVIPSPFYESLQTDIFQQRIRFKKSLDESYKDWKETKLSQLLVERKCRNTDGEFTEVFSVAKEKGVINQLEHLGRSYASDDITNYKVVFPNDIVYTKSPTAGFPYGIVKQNKTGRTGVVSVLYAVFKPKSSEIGLLLDYYFSSWVNAFNYLRPITNLGAKNTININNDVFINGAKISFPTDKDEIVKITNLLQLIDLKIELQSKQVEFFRDYKKGLLQKMFY